MCSVVFLTWGSECTKQDKLDLSCRSKQAFSGLMNAFEAEDHILCATSGLVL